MFGVTQRSKGGTIVRLLHPSQYQTAYTDFRFLSIDFLHLENTFRVMIPKFVTEFVTALWDRTDATPLTVTNLEYLVDQVLSHQVPFPFNHAGILILDIPFTLFELLDCHENTLENIQRLEASNHDRNMKALRDGLVFSIPHHGTDVTGA